MHNENQPVHQPIQKDDRCNNAFQRYGRNDGFENLLTFELPLLLLRPINHKVVLFFSLVSYILDLLEIGYIAHYAV